MINSNNNYKNIELYFKFSKKGIMDNRSRISTTNQNDFISGQFFKNQYQILQKT